MKSILFLALALLSNVFLSRAQDNEPVKAKVIIQDFPLDITWHKTTVLIFPAPIKNADRGDSYVLAEKAGGVENMLKIKAGERDFLQSNLHVVTTDGKVYAFTVNYNEFPQHFTIDMGRQYPHSPATFDGISLNSRELELKAATIRAMKPFISGVKHHKYDMELKLEGIFVKDNVLMMHYRLKNHSQIRYDGQPPRFYVKDKKRSKRTAVQDTEIEAVFVQRNGKPEDKQGQSIVVAFPKFTIAESKLFVAEFMEQGGDRNLKCQFDQKKLLKGKMLH